MSEASVVSITIRHDHPSLAGHFPGNPVIPGVVILEEVFEAIRQIEPVKIALLGLPSVKFHSPLRPKEEMTICLEPYQPQGRGFFCQSGNRLIASGRFRYERAEEPTGSEE